MKPDEPMRCACCNEPIAEGLAVPGGEDFYLCAACACCENCGAPMTWQSGRPEPGCDCD